MSLEVYCIVNENIKLSEPTKKKNLAEPLAYENTKAHCFRVTVYKDDGTSEDLTGIGVTGSFLRSDNVTVEPMLGTVSGNVAEVIIEPSCYVCAGRYKFTLDLTKPTPTTGISDFSTSEDYSAGNLVVYSGVVYRFTADHDAGAWTGTDVVPDATTRTALWVEGYVERKSSASIVDPGTPVSNIDTAIGNANAAASSASSAATAANTAATNAGDMVKYIAVSEESSTATAAHAIYE